MKTMYDEEFNKPSNWKPLEVPPLPEKKVQKNFLTVDQLLKTDASKRLILYSDPEKVIEPAAPATTPDPLGPAK